SLVAVRESAVIESVGPIKIHEQALVGIGLDSREPRRELLLAGSQPAFAVADGENELRAGIPDIQLPIEARNRRIGERVIRVDEVVITRREVRNSVLIDTHIVFHILT